MKFKTLVYSNAFETKVKNKRLTTAYDDLGVTMQFKIFDTDERPPVLYEHVKGKVWVTELKISKEGAHILAAQLMRAIEKGLL